MATTYLTRTPSSTSTRKKLTFSAWCKRANINSEGMLIHALNNSSESDGLRFYTDNSLNCILSNGNDGSVTTNRKFTDPNAFYHIMWVVDTTQGTASDRIKLYVNGIQETSFSAASYPSQDFVMEGMFVSAKPMYIGTQLDGGSGSNYFGGVMSFVNIIDGTAYTPSSFGSTDSVTGQWKINTSPSVTYGTNGSLILKNGNTITDQSGNSNNWTLAAGTLTNTEDCPSNNFATWNKSIGYTDALTNGNTTVTRSASGWRGAFSSLPLPTTGKFYCEFKISSGSNLSDLRAGIADDSFDGSIDLQNRNQVNQLGEQTNGISYTASNGNSSINASEASYGSAISTSNVLGMAVDMTNMKLYFSKDGVFQNSGDPTSGATGTGALAIPATLGKYFVAVGVNTSAWHVNFGNGTFGTIDITDAGTPGSTPGEFEYDVPTGYQPLTTKGLNA